VNKKSIIGIKVPIKEPRKKLDLLDVINVFSKFKWKAKRPKYTEQIYTMMDITKQEILVQTSFFLHKLYFD
jgi:hypothetical protein